MAEPRRLIRQDTFDIRDQIQGDPQSHADAANYAGTDDEEHSVLEDDSDGEERDVDYMDDDDDGSSSLSIPNESIDFDLVYSLHSFAATVEGQANVVKGDSLFLMDDSNSYWWLVRVLKTQEVGYIPAENIETPFERLARLNKHRNVDLASATQAELQEDVHASRERLRNNISSRTGSNQTPSPIPRGNGARSRSPSSRGVAFTSSLSVHRYPPAVWNEDEEEEDDVEWDDEAYEGEDTGLAEEQMQQQRAEEVGPPMDLDDGMAWDDSVAEEMQARQTPIRAPQAQTAGTPAVLRFAPTVEQQQAQQLQLQQQQQQQQQHLQAQQQQQLQQQKQQQLVAQQQQSAQQIVSISQQPGPGQQQILRKTSRDHLVDNISSASQQPLNRIDPLEATETRKVTVTPTIARDPSVRVDQEPKPSGPLLPSAVMKQQDEERKRTREEIEALEESARKKSKGKMAPPVSSASLSRSNSGSSGGKLRKDQPEDDGSKDKDKKKKGSVFGFFGRRKDKSKDKQTASIASTDSTGDVGRGSEDSTRSAGRPSVSAVVDAVSSPTTAMAIQQQQQQQQQRVTQQQQQQQQPPPQQLQQPSTPTPQVSQHASQLRQRDQHQQALYQQYLNRSPSSPPEAQANYGLQTAAVMTGSNSYSSTTSSASGLAPGQHTPRPRPGSLILSPTSIDGQGVPELSVIRVFAGKNLQTEATFKTVLLNTSTTSSDLVRQAIQRFRLPAGEDSNDYYLTVKQVEGSSAVLLPAENPLGVFETLVEAAMELPKVKRSSVGSISSVASNLSMHPAIKKLSMNDFTDDSAVKFYLNKKGPEGVEDSVTDHGGDDTMVADTKSDPDGHPVKSQYLTVSPALANNVMADRFSSPSFRFALQLVIYPDDLPDDMVFDPMTEAIVFKHTLRDRLQTTAGPTSSSGVSQHMRRKVFVFPKNVTVAEVIELGLERFGILEGVVDGGDEVEDKLTKRRSSTRVRYGLVIGNGSQERELAPSSKVIDAFTRPPTYRAVERQFSDRKRRSIDSAQLLGSLEDINPADPIFILRRAISYRNSASRHRISAPLDELALHQLHRESASTSVSSASSDTQMHSHPSEDGKRQLSKQEIIAAQRAASRANQRAILSAQSNSLRGVDVLLSGNAMLRSSRYEVDDRMRYSYVQPDGETYDISDIIEEEWRENNVQKNDLLEGVLARNKDAIGDRLDRLLTKIKTGKPNSQASLSQSVSASTMESNLNSDYSIDDPAIDEGLASRASTPGFIGRSPTPTQRSISPTAKSQSPAPDLRTRSSRAASPSMIPTKIGTGRQPSIASVMSDLAGYSTPPQTDSTLLSENAREAAAMTPKPRRKRPVIPRDDFGVSHMMAVIEFAGSTPKPVLPKLHPVDELLYGRKFNIGTLHPEIRGIYDESFKHLEDMDKTLDEFLQNTIGIPYE